MNEIDKHLKQVTTTHKNTNIEISHERKKIMFLCQNVTKNVNAYDSFKGFHVKQLIEQINTAVI